MVEHSFAVDNLRLSFKGVFDFEEFYKVINSWVYDKGYLVSAPFDAQFENKKGRQHNLDLVIWKPIIEEVHSRIHLRIKAIDVNDVEVEAAGVSKVVGKGRLTVEFDGILRTDRHNWWSKRPFFWFINIMMNKYFLKDYFSRAEQWLMSDIQDLYVHMKNFLNVTVTKQRDVMQPWVIR